VAPPALPRLDDRGEGTILLPLRVVGAARILFMPQCVDRADPPLPLVDFFLLLGVTPVCELVVED